MLSNYTENKINNSNAIEISSLNKCYQIYDRPSDRFLQLFSKSKKFKEFWALKNINFAIKKGETIGIIGKNGSGKSTLLQIICGTLSPTNGNVNVNGRIAALLELGAGFNFEFTGRENVYLNASLLGLNIDQINAKFEEIERFADIGEFIDRPVKHYSSGMFARLAFSVAIHVDPEILIVDEILAVGDASFQKKCMNKFYEIREKGCTILFVSHDSYQIRSVCSKALYLNKGNQVLYGDASEVMDLYQYEQENIESHSEKDSIDRISLDNTTSLVKIDNVYLNTDIIVSGDDLEITFDFTILNLNLIPAVSFVVNLYRHDDLYICGTTTLMEGFPAYKTQKKGTVKVKFPNLRLLAGHYKWRVAVNDDKGLGILAEANPICEFQVKDHFGAVGLIDLERHWEISFGGEK